MYVFMVSSPVHGDPRLRTHILTVSNEIFCWTLTITAQIFAIVYVICFRGVLMLKYAFLLEDKAMFQVNTAAIILNLVYVFCYAIYSRNRKNEIVKPLAKGITLMGVLLGYARWEDSDVLEYRYGFIVTILMLLLLGSPLVDIVSNYFCN